MTCRQRLTSLLATVFAVSYFGLAHTAAITQSPAVTLIAAAVLALVVLLPGLATGRVGAFIALLAVAPTLYWLHQQQLAMLPLYAPPVLINLLLAWTFGRTLRQGHTPLIFRFVQLMHPPEDALDPAIEPYARRLTMLWTLLFVTMATVNLALALIARPEGLLLTFGVEPPITVPQSVWSAFANVINYLLVGLFFVLEFAWRRVRFPNQPYRGFFDFMRRLIAIGPKAQAALRDEQ